jgi:hypothetical protein
MEGGAEAADGVAAERSDGAMEGGAEAADGVNHEVATRRSDERGSGGSICPPTVSYIPHVTTIHYIFILMTYIAC